MSSPVKRKRVTMKLKNPNPLFTKWITEWKIQAQEKDSKMQYCFSIALSSLNKYPLPLQSGRDCKILKGFGDKLCGMLDAKLREFKAHGEDLNATSPTINPSESKEKKTTLRKKSNTPRKSQGESKEYVPQYGSGPFAILVTLYEKTQELKQTEYLNKNELITSAQHLCNTSFTKPVPGSRYTAWSSMKTLLEKELVLKQGSPARFTLTESGIILGEKLYIQQRIEEFQASDNGKEAQTEKPQSSCAPRDSAINLTITGDKINVLPENNLKKAKKGPVIKQRSNITSTAPTSSQSNTTYESVILAGNSFDILLLVDNQELTGSKSSSDSDPLLNELSHLNVKFETRNLKVGDYLWICRDPVSGVELVLPYIIERKRMDDFGHSIKDGRFHEQKFRLKQCGCQNLIYLIENYGRNDHVGLPINNLYQAAANTLVQDGFVVKFTDDIRGTAEYLACLSNLITKLFKAKTVVSCAKEDLSDVVMDDDLVCLMHFQEFNKNASKIKHYKVRDMFVKQLLQIKGMSVDKAFAIVDNYPTPRLLKSAYEELDSSKGEKLLATVSYGILKKKIGPILGKTVYQLFCNASF